MKFKSEIVTSASGSIGGVSYQKSRGGLVRQAKPRNTNSNSPQQRSIRNVFASLAWSWNNALSDLERATWTNYAHLTPITGKLGDPLVLSGSKMFVRYNTLRVGAGLTILNSGPTEPGLTPLIINKAEAHTGFPFLQILFDVSLPWATAVGGFMTIQTTRFLPQARNSFSGGTRTLTTVLGAATPIANETIEGANAFGQVVNTTRPGLKMRYRFIAGDSTGRLSAVVERFVTIQ